MPLIKLGGVPGTTSKLNLKVFFFFLFKFS
jgi:hypothetical protein